MGAPPSRWKNAGSLFEEALARPSEPETKDSDARPDVGPYRVLEEIGRGGMGIVYKARDDRLDRYVALKCLKRTFGSAGSERERLLEEARAASRLDHSNICAIHDVGETPDGRFFFVMAYCEGETLRDKIEAGPLPIDTSVELARQIASGLGRAHEAGVIHRDVKPSNVMVNSRGEVKILDFGLAQIEAQSHTHPGPRLGTPAYMAPEQDRGEVVDARADIWSLGAVLWEMLAGRRARRQERTGERLRALRPEVPCALAAVVERCLAPLPADRYPSTAELIRDLDRAREGASSEDSLFTRRRGVHLPAALDRFVGRESDTAEVKALLSRSRLVTLTGPAGTGKTRLALQVASESAEDYEDGVFFVDLAPLHDPKLVPSAMAGALGVSQPPAQSVRDALHSVLARRKVLLLLDNFEHVTEAAPSISELLAACPGVRILATSRALLRVRGESPYEVRPLALPSSDQPTTPHLLEGCSSVALLVDRARAAYPRFRITAENASWVAELCRRLEGLPLAIELAAPRLRLFSPKALVERLDRGFDLLSEGPRDLPERQRTLRRAIAWSYELLTPAERRLFRRLAVFAGGATLETISAVVGKCPDRDGDVGDDLAALTEHSLVRCDEQADGEPRFSMLATLREFGREMLAAAGEEGELRGHHAEHFLAMAERSARALSGEDQVEAFQRLGREHDDLRAALSWAEEVGNREVGLRLAVALFRFWLSMGHAREGARRLRHWLDSGKAIEADPTVARALRYLGILVLFEGRNNDARVFFSRALAMWHELGDARGLARELNNLAWAHNELSRFDAAETVARDALGRNRELGSRSGAAIARNHLGWSALYRGCFPRAREHFSECVALRRELGDRLNLGFSLTTLAWVELCLGSLEGAEKLLAEATGNQESMGDRTQRLWTETVQGCLRQLQGEPVRAETLLRHSSAGLRRMGSGTASAWAFDALGWLLARQGRFDEARDVAQGELDWAGRGECPWSVARAEALAGYIALRRGRSEEAAGLLTESLEHRRELGDWGGTASSLEALAELAFLEGQPAVAALRLAVADRLRQARDAPVAAFQVPDRNRLAARLGDVEPTVEDSESDLLVGPVLEILES